MDKKNTNTFSKENIESLVKNLNVSAPVNVDYVYDIYMMTNEAMKELQDTKVINENVTPNPMEMFFYCFGEYLYSTSRRKPDDLKEFLKNEDFQYSMASVAADKYVTLSVFNYNETKVVNKYFPPISTLNLYSNFMLKILEGYKQKDPSSTLLTDLLVKSLSILRCILLLLTEGYETEALASWRTLHECECTLILLEKYKEPLIKAYLKHMRYGIAYKDNIEDKNEQDQIFIQIKEEMKAFDLKSKDIKKYIEYGWLTTIKDYDFKNDPNLKLNFRDGLERLADLNKYSDTYQLSSEILHCTPLLIYSNKQYFYLLTILNTYESFFRLEEVFVSLFEPHVGEAGIKQYEMFKKVYLSQLHAIHDNESRNFSTTVKVKKQKEE